MADSTGNGSYARWTAPECPFVIEYDAGAIDDIRLAVTDAFFSLPRGGAEIGGILLGGFSGGRLTITGYTPLECEHAYGPGFTLSPNDHKQLAALIASTPGGGKDVAGWYHSHTRSEITLSGADLEVYNRYFPEPWQVSMVMKPSAFTPARCGFFFRRQDGSIQTEPANEFELTPQPVAPAPAQAGPERRWERAEAHPKEEPAPRRPSLTLDAVLKAAESEPSADAAAPTPAKPVESPPAPRAESEPERAVPSFAGATSEPRTSPWYWLAVAVLVGVLAYQTRDYWMGAPRNPAPEAGTGVGTAPPASTQSAAQTRLALAVGDAAGQLQVRWDGTSQFVLDAAKGLIEIEDGEHKAAVPLNQERLRSGSFSYARESQAVSIRLTVEDERGRRQQEAATFFGKLPDKPAAGGDPEAAKQRDQLTQEVTRLRTALATQTERANKLEKALDEARRQWKRDQQRRRLENQIRDPLQ